MKRKALALLIPLLLLTTAHVCGLGALRGREAAAGSARGAT